MGKSISSENTFIVFDFEMSVDYPGRDGNVEDAVLMMLEYCPGGDLYEIVYYTGKLEEKVHIFLRMGHPKVIFY